MTSFCKSNVRRVINYTQHEPINKYDLWLSENARYNDQGEIEYDNDGLPACDLILKLFRHGRWEPIVGFNTTALNKINTVANADPYQYTYGGHQYTSEGITQFHLPLFRDPEDSPAELFDAGTLGNAAATFISEEEWQNIIANGGLGDALETYLGNGNIEIPFATTELCGGILSDTHTCDDINSFKPIEVKFYPTISHYQSKRHRLSISASEVIDQINSYQDDNPNGSHIEISSNTTVNPTALYNSFDNSSSILKGWHEDLLTDENAQKPFFVLPGTGLVENRGKFLRLKPNGEWWSNHSPDYDNTNNAIEWVDIDSPIEYVGGAGILISSDEISQNIEQNNDTITITPTSIIVSEGSDNNIEITLIDENSVRETIYAGIYEYVDLSNYSEIEYGFTSIPTLTNPIYLKIHSKDYANLFIGQGILYIGDYTSISNTNPCLVTILFGVIKFEEIETQSSSVL